MKSKAEKINWLFWILLGVMSLAAITLENMHVIGLGGEDYLMIFGWQFKMALSLGLQFSITSSMIAQSLFSLVTAILLYESGRKSSRKLFKNTFEGLAIVIFMLSLIYVWDAIAFHFMLVRRVDIISSWKYHTGLRFYWQLFLFNALPIALAINLILRQLKQFSIADKAKNEDIAEVKIKNRLDDKFQPEDEEADLSKAAQQELSV